MTAAGVDDFSMADIYKPTYKRTRRNLSALINFAKFREERLFRYQELDTQSETLMAKYEKAVKECQSVAEQIAAIEERREADEPKRRELEAQNNDLMNRLSALNKEQSDLRAEIQNAKDEMAKIKTRIEEYNFQTLAAKQEVQQLRAQIVSSPQKLQSQIEQLKITVSSDKQYIAETQDKARALASKLDAIASLESALAGLIGAADEAAADYERVIEEEARLEEHQARAERASIQANELAAGEILLDKQLAATQDKAKRFETQAKLKKDAVQLALEKARDEHRSCEREFSSAKVKLDENTAVIRELTSRRDAMLQEHEAEIGAMEASFDNLRENARAYHRQLFDALACTTASTGSSAVPPGVPATPGRSNLSASFLSRAGLMAPSTPAPVGLADLR